MKRFFTLTICLFLLHFTKASANPAQGINGKITPGDTTLAPIISQLVAQSAPYSTSIFKLRLDSIQKDVQLDYNEYVQGYIDIYTRHKDEMSQVLGLSKYYFPIYEKIFREAGIPQEIKYLSIVESKLDPNAVSRVGATGPWQFMATTAKIYGLNMDGYIDERRDPIQASYAAAAYLKDAYQEFGDWLLAIASYNCGKSNVERAVEKAGAMDFWAIRQYLPNETRGYVPAFIAMSYVMNYADKHNINPQLWDLATRTDTVWVDKHITLSNIAKALSVDVKELALFNPSYKKQVINGTVAKPRRLVIPNTGDINYNLLYEALNNPNAVIVQPKPTYVAKKAEPIIEKKETDVISTVETRLPEPNPNDIYIVKRGESMIDVASTTGLDPKELKRWNHLQSSKLTTGQRLRLSANAYIPEVLSPKKTGYVTYKVKPGDTLSEIADKFDGATTESIRSLNGLKKGVLQPGMTLKISRG